MKKLLSALFAIMLAASLAYGAGTCTETFNAYRDGDWMVTLTCTGDATDGTYPATTVDFRGEDVNSYIYMVVTDPGTTAPTDNYDITITDANGIDIMGGELLNRDESNTEQAVPKIDSIYGSRRVNGDMTVNISGNSVTAAQVVIKIFGYRDQG